MAKEISLKQFQQELAAKLREANTHAASNARLGVQAGAQLWLIRLEEAGEVLPPPEITPVPLTRPWFLGLANVRGTLAGVVDFSAFIGQAATVRTPDCRLVLVAERFGVHSALMVERLIGLRNIGQFNAEQGESDWPWIRGSYRDPDGLRWRELDLSSLVAHGDYLQVGV